MTYSRLALFLTSDTSYYIANNNRCTAVILLPRPDVVQVTLLPTTDVQQSILLTKADKLFRHYIPCSTSRKALPHKALSQYSDLSASNFVSSTHENGATETEGIFIQDV